MKRQPSPLLFGTGAPGASENLLWSWASSAPDLQDRYVLGYAGVAGSPLKETLSRSELAQRVIVLGRLLRLGSTRAVRSLALEVLRARLGDPTTQDVVAGLIGLLDDTLIDAVSDLRGDPRGDDGEPTRRREPRAVRPDVASPPVAAAACTIAAALDDLESVHTALASTLFLAVGAAMREEEALDLEHILRTASHGVRSATDLLSQEEVDAVVELVRASPPVWMREHPHLLALGVVDFESWWLPRPPLFPPVRPVPFIWEPPVLGLAGSNRPMPMPSPRALEPAVHDRGIEVQVVPANASDGWLILRISLDSKVDFDLVATPSPDEVHADDLHPARWLGWHTPPEVAIEVTITPLEPISARRVKLSIQCRSTSSGE